MFYNIFRFIVYQSFFRNFAPELITLINMKKSILFFAMLLCTLAASATVINAVPEGDIAYYLSIAQPGDIIELADGVYDEKSILTFSVEGLVVKAAEGATPVIQTVGKWMKINVEATTTFEGIVFDAEAGTDGDNQYGFDISANTTFNDCKFQDYTKYDVKILAETTTFDNCIFNGADVTPSAIIIDGTIAECSIENCEFKNYKDYNISVEDNTTITTLTIDQCVLDGANTESVKTTKAALFTKGIVSTSNIQDSEFKNFAECAITVDKWYGGRYDALAINNCRIHDCVNSAIYLPYAIDTNEKQTCSDFKLTNSTIYNIGNGGSFGAIDIQDNANIVSEQKVLIDHVTIYNFLNSGYYGGIRVEKAADAVVSNCIVMNPEQNWANPYRLFTGAQVSNCIYYNTEISSESTATFTNCTQADPLFVDAANANFQLYAESPAIGMGDPRWGVKAGLQPGNGALKKAVAAAAPGATIELGDGEYVETSSIDFNKEGLIIKAADGTKPVIKASYYLKHNATTTFIGITFDGQGTAEYTTYSYETNTEKNLTFINCEFKAYTNSCVTLGSAANVNQLTISGCTFDGGNTTPAAIKSSGIINTCEIKTSEIKGYTEYGFVANSSAHTEELSIDNCIIHDCGYAAVYVCKASDSSEQQSCSVFKLTNSTIYNIGNDTQDHGAVDIRDNANIASTQQVLIDHVTLYNFTTKDWYGGFMIYQSGNATISNCIVSNPASGKNGYHVYANANVTNSLYYNCNITSGAQQTANIEADPLFVDATNGNFQLYANSPAVGKGTDMSNLGDPRWGVSTNYKGTKIAIEPGQAKLNSAVGYSVNAGDTIVLKDGIYEEPWTFNLDKEGLVIMAAENAKPIIKLTNEATVLNIQATTTFNGITFDAGNVANYILATTEATSGTLTITNCEFKNWAYWAISNKSETAASIEAVIIDNCLFHDGAEAAIYFSQKAPEGKHACNYFKMTNSTIYNVKSTKYAGIVHVSSNAEAEGMQNKVIIDHVTMYNLDGADLGIIAVRKSSDLTISNTIIANPAAGERASYVYGGVAEKVIYFNVSQDGDLTYTSCLTDDPLFVDAANNDFMLQATSPAIGKATDGSNLGDPRWGVAEPAFITLTTGDNSAVIAANIGKTVDVVIERSFTANDGYYTLCVPFNMPASVIGKAYSLGTITEHVSGQGININLEEVSELSAGMPYLVLPKANMSELIVESVTILPDMASGQSTRNDELNVQIFFQGYYSASGQTNGTTQYYVGNNGDLYNEVVDIRGLCGLFTITDKEGNPAKVRARVVTREDAATGFENITNGENTTIKLIENGQLIIIRNGEKFNAQGVRL